MAAFLEDHGTALIGIAPVAPHKAVRLMPVADVFRRLDRDNIPDFPIIKKLFDPLIKRGVAQHMADHNVPIVLFGGLGNVAAVGKSGGNGLFQQKMVALFQSGKSLAVVLAVHSAYEQHVRKLWAGKHFSRAGKAHFFRDGKLPPRAFQFFRIGIGNGSDLDFSGHLGGDPPVSGQAARAKSRDSGVYNLFHSKNLPVFSAG